MARKTCDLVSKYLSDIGRTRLINAIEEVQLGVRVRHGDEKARKILIEAHLRLVVKIAKHYSRRLTGILNLLDLIEEGNMGLIKAVDKFDPEKGYRFSTHAAYWIKDSIQVAIMNHSRTVRLPANVHREIASLVRDNHQIQQCTQRKVSSSELMSFTKVDIRRADFLMLWGGLSKTQLTAMEERNESIEIEQLKSETPHFEPEYNMLHETLKQRLHLAFDSLTLEQRSLLKVRFGLNGREPLSVESVALQVGMSNEAVRQRQKQAIEKMAKKLRLVSLR